MKIYVLEHRYNNGEEFPEDFEVYHEYKLFSTSLKVDIEYAKEIFKNYIGKYIVYSYELDTQKKQLLYESPWINCSSALDKYQEEVEDYQEESEPQYYYDYHDWFKDQFMKDYDKALDELIPTDRELCLLRLAREARHKPVSFESINKFFRVYNLSSEEQILFMNEYWQCKPM